MKKTYALFAILALITVATVSITNAEESVPEFNIAIKDHQFTPSELTVPANQKFKLIVDNQDNSPEEFESIYLRLEKVIPGQSKASLKVEPLPAGTYTFVGEFHEDTAKGKIIAK